MKARMESGGNKSGAEKPRQESPKVRVINQLLALARTIRRRATPDEAVAAAEYETRLTADLEKAKAA